MRSIASHQGHACTQRTHVERYLLFPKLLFNTLFVGLKLLLKRSLGAGKQRVIRVHASGLPKDEAVLRLISRRGCSLLRLSHVNANARSKLPFLVECYKDWCCGFNIALSAPIYNSIVVWCHHRRGVHVASLHVRAWAAPEPSPSKVHAIEEPTAVALPSCNNTTWTVWLNSFYNQHLP